jgi:hypothetical protein
MVGTVRTGFGSSPAQAGRKRRRLRALVGEVAGGASPAAGGFLAWDVSTRLNQVLHPPVPVAKVLRCCLAFAFSLVSLPLSRLRERRSAVLLCWTPLLHTVAAAFRSPQPPDSWSMEVGLHRIQFGWLGVGALAPRVHLADGVPPSLVCGGPARSFR